MDIPDLFDTWHYLCCSTCDPADLAGLIGYKSLEACEEARQRLMEFGQVVSQCIEHAEKWEPNNILACRKP
jgi:hypothetical protein